MKVQLTDMLFSNDSVELVFSPVNGHTDLHPEHKDLVAIVTIQLNQFPEVEVDGAFPDFDGNGQNKDKIVIKFKQFDMFPKKWQKTIDIKKDLYNENLSLKEIAKKINGFLRPETEDTHYLEAGLDLLEEAGEADDVELFDEGLTLIYDWADENRVWLGV